MQPSSRHPQYIFPPNAGTPQVREFGSKVAAAFSVHPQLGEMLHHRGFTTLDQVSDYLYPQLSMLPSPDSMKDTDRAVACILATLRARQPILIHGDYDVDGITATALLLSFFREIGCKATCYIPNRLEESYGLSEGSIDKLIAQAEVEKTQGGVLISVDCGITAVHEVAYAQELGLRVVITDHHEPQKELPRAEAILNPKQKNCHFPFTELAGVGVAFFLVIALRKALIAAGLLPIGTLPNLKKHLDLVALGTVADVVPLVGVNRILVKAGLEVLSLKSRLGILSLCECCGIADHQILSDDIAFKLAPRINAAGRLGNPQAGVRLLVADTLEQARCLAQELDRMNSERKQLELGILEAVKECCRKQVDEGAHGLVVYEKNCHPGVSGIIASRITELFRRPVIIFTDDYQLGKSAYLKGSGRSVAGVNLFQTLERCSQWIDQFGGHAMAAGLTIKKSNFANLSIEFNKINTSLSAFSQQDKGVIIDYHCQDKELLGQGFFQSLQLMQPFGEGNPEPIFLLSGEHLLHSREVKGHLVFQVRAARCLFPGIGFRLADSGQNFNKPVDLVFRLKRSWFKGVGRDQIQALRIITT